MLIAARSITILSRKETQNLPITGTTNPKARKVPSIIIGETDRHFKLARLFYGLLESCSFLYVMLQI